MASAPLVRNIDMWGYSHLFPFYCAHVHVIGYKWYMSTFLKSLWVENTTLNTINQHHPGFTVTKNKEFYIASPSHHVYILVSQQNDMAPCSCFFSSNSPSILSLLVTPNTKIHKLIIEQHILNVYIYYKYKNGYLFVNIVTCIISLATRLYILFYECVYCTFWKVSCGTPYQLQCTALCDGLGSDFAGRFDIIKCLKNIYIIFVQEFHL